MSARSGAPGQRARKRLFTGVNGLEERVEKLSWRGLVPGGEIERHAPGSALKFRMRSFAKVDANCRRSTVPRQWTAEKIGGPAAKAIVIVWS